MRRRTATSSTSAKGKALIAAAGYGPQKPLKITVGISTSGSGQMLPLPMNEFLQQSLKENCGVEIAFQVVEWNTLLAGLRATPDAPQWLGADALNISLVSSDPSQMARWFLSSNATPVGSNAGHWKDAGIRRRLRHGRDRARPGEDRRRADPRA